MDKKISLNELESISQAEKISRLDGGPGSGPRKSGDSNKDREKSHYKIEKRNAEKRQADDDRKSGKKKHSSEDEGHTEKLSPHDQHIENHKVATMRANVADESSEIAKRSGKKEDHMIAGIQQRGVARRLENLGRREEAVEHDRKASEHEKHSGASDALGKILADLPSKANEVASEMTGKK